MKKEDETHMQIVSADISSESLTGMVIFRPHCVSRSGRNAGEADKGGNWYALRPAEVRSFARAAGCGRCAGSEGEDVAGGEDGGDLTCAGPARREFSRAGAG
ncbi:hypothetical protein [Rhodanobacter lindaniclasticus]|uniref:hypothetical protein n=1 Tax=Rhodanobacter lindaniclasticus TaxID=75310 RepID=UPI001FEA010E|nr:hypothetical protein [Rhodanobacter lindaniclasticus]